MSADLSPHSNHGELPCRAGRIEELVSVGFCFCFFKENISEKKSQRQNQVGEFEELCRQSQGQSGVTEQRHQRRFGELLGKQNQIISEKYLEDC